MQTILKQGILKESVWLIAVAMIDLISTIILISAGLCREMNPLMNYFLKMGWGPFILFKMATVVLAISVAEWYRR